MREWSGRYVIYFYAMSRMVQLIGSAKIVSGILLFSGIFLLQGCFLKQTTEENPALPEGTWLLVRTETWSISVPDFGSPGESNHYSQTWDTSQYIYQSFLILEGQKLIVAGYWGPNLSETHGPAYLRPMVFPGRELYDTVDVISLPGYRMLLNGADTLRFEGADSTLTLRFGIDAHYVRYTGIFPPPLWDAISGVTFSPGFGDSLRALFPIHSD